MIYDNEVAAGSKICLMPDVNPQQGRPDRIYHDGWQADFTEPSGCGYRLRQSFPGGGSGRKRKSEEVWARPITELSKTASETVHAGHNQPGIQAGKQAISFFIAL